MSRWVTRNKRAGFTIVELLIVIVVIGILAGLIFVQFNNAQRRARDAQRKSDIEQIVKALEVYYTLHGQYPASSGSTTINGSWSTTADSSWDNVASILQPHVSPLPRDPISTPNAPVTSASGYNYAYFTHSTSYCGVPARKAFLLVYRLEAEPQKNDLIGDCTVNPMNPYGGVSNYRVATP